MPDLRDSIYQPALVPGSNLAVVHKFPQPAVGKELEPASREKANLSVREADLAHGNSARRDTEASSVSRIEAKTKSVLAILIVSFFVVVTLISIAYGIVVQNWSLFEHIWIPFIIVVTLLGNHYFYERKRSSS